MSRKGKINLICLLFCLLSVDFASMKAQSPLVANPGPNVTICPSGTGVIGGTPAATGGKGGTYTYSWSPSSGLSSTSVPNPTFTLGSSPNVTYTLTVKDSSGATNSATVTVGYMSIWFAHAGSDQSYCGGSIPPLNAIIGLNNPGSGVTYSWTPAVGLSSSSAPSPVASPTVTTTYTMIATQSPCPPRSETVTVNVHQPPPVKAGPWTVIHQGGKATLHGSGAVQYYWTPPATITYNGSPTPDAEPRSTITYTVEATDKYGCIGYDTVTVFVIPDTHILVYNTFTPNNDGNNDTWFIGNITYYPNCKVQVFNRYGKLVYSKSGYQNDWDGTNFGEKLPEATYYYVIDLGDGVSSVYRGSITIIR
jgi:gliding motility-associated-like protein